MKNIRKRILAVILAVASVLGLVGMSGAPASAAPVRPAVTATSYTDCGQSAFLGTRVCVDKTTGFGPVAYIYTSGTGVYTTFGVGIVGINSPSSFVATPIEYQNGSIANYPGGLLYSTYALPGTESWVVTNGDANAKALLDWFSADSSYEFVVAN